MNNILVVGTGALASLFAARLAGAGHNVTMLGTWKEGLHAIRTNGVRLIDSHDRVTQFNIHVTDDPRACTGVKHALVLVKAWQTERAAAQLSQCLAEDGLAVTLQNGLGNREVLAQFLDHFATGPTEKTREKDSQNSALSVAKKSSRVALGVTTTGATLLGPGLVKAGGEGQISIERHHALGPLEEALKSADFQVQIVEDARALIWGKLVINCAINPLTALLRLKNGELLERPSAREIMGQLARETAQVAVSENITLPFDDPAAAAEEVARKTAANQSSMLQDVLRGAPTEIDAICGAVVKTAQEHGMEAPANLIIWQLVKALTESATYGV